MNSMPSKPSHNVVDADDTFTAPDGRGKYSVLNRRKLAALLATKGEHANLDINLMLKYLTEQGVIKDENLAEPSADSFFAMKLSDPFALDGIRGYMKSCFADVTHLLNAANEMTDQSRFEEAVPILSRAHALMDYGCHLLQLIQNIRAANITTKIPD